MSHYLTALAAFITGLAVVGFFAGMGIHRDAIRRNPTLPDRTGAVIMRVFGIVIIGAIATIIIMPPCR